MHPREGTRLYNVVDDVRREIRSRIIGGLAGSGILGALGDFTDEDVPVEYTRDKAHGDFATPIPLVLAGKVKRKPKDIAETIVDHMEIARGKTRYIQRVEVAGPGFINFFLGRRWLEDVLRTIMIAGPEYGRSRMGHGARILLEFVSANPTGPMNIVNARAAAVGASLANILKASGYDVSTEYYVNDAGGQINVLGSSCELRYLELKGEDVEFPEWGYQGSYIVDIARLAMENHGKELDAMETEERAEFFRGFALSRMLADQKASLSRFGVEFDVWFSERKLVDSGTVSEVIDILMQRGMAYEEEDALWLRATKFGDEKDRVLIKSDGDYTYLASDLNQHDISSGLFSRLSNLRFDFVCHMRNDLNSAAEETTFTLTVYYGPVYHTCSDVIASAKIYIDKPLVVAKIQICLSAVFCNEDFSMLIRAHCAGIHIDVRIQL
jgi:arginyl-tRNA synthetase